MSGAPSVTTYADDFVVFCHSREQAESVRAQLDAWLTPKGLVLNQDKTKIVPVTEGFDFLGFNIRRYQTSSGGKLLIKPSNDAMKAIRRRLATEIRRLRAATPAILIGRLNPIIRGWAAYYRIGVSSAAFHALDNYLWRLLYNWARRRHPNKPKRWIKNRYFGRFNKDRQDTWVFGDRQTGVYLHKFSWTPIVRHVLVKGTASPDDPALTRYWADRRRNRKLPPLAPSLMRSLRAQRGRCPLCGNSLTDADREPQSPSQWEEWFFTLRTTLSHHRVAQTSGQPDEHYRLVHARCARRHPGDTAPAPAVDAGPAPPTGAA
ncbi:hypothetical protein BCD48_45085 [Pseudofrankia sp. BMG5.36]|nr:hypothetical protein BCD48_45085 [Pseudofrankia sp. BMG5.36]